MGDRMDDFRKRLLESEETSAELKEAYRKEVEGLVSPALTGRAKAVGTVLLVLLLTATALIVRADVVYHVEGMMLAGHGVLGVGFLWAAWLIVRGLMRGKYLHQSVSSIAGILTAASGTMTALVLMMGVGHATDVKTLFGAFYVFVFYFACAMWSVETRIGTAELAGKEQGLRIEYRLAEMMERMGK